MSNYDSKGRRCLPGGIYCVPGDGSRAGGGKFICYMSSGDDDGIFIPGPVKAQSDGLGAVELLIPFAHVQ